MRRGVLVAVPDRWEASLVEALASSRVLEVVRRCADVPELLSVAAAGLGEYALVSTSLRGLDRSVIGDLRRHGVLAVGIYRPGDESDERALRQLGLVVVLPADADRGCLDEALAGDAPPGVLRLFPGVGPAGVDVGASAATGAAPMSVAPGDAWRIPADAGPPPATSRGPAPWGVPTMAAGEETPRHGRGRIVAVWGPAGAPGRSTVAITLASEAARLGVSALLIDADPYGGVVAPALSLLDESPGLAAALRAADQGGLDVPGLAARCLRVAPQLAVLTGIARADRWPELRADPLEVVLTMARQVAALVVVDCGFSLEEDEELSYDTLAPRRNAATLTTLAQADHVVVVGSADPIGLQRLVRGVQELGTVRAPAARTVVVNRVRASAVGPGPERAIAEALARFVGLTEPWFVPDDRAALDRALLQGRTLAECAPDSPARRALAALAARLVGRTEPAAAPPRRHAVRGRRARGGQSV